MAKTSAEFEKEFMDSIKDQTGKTLPDWLTMLKKSGFSKQMAVSYTHLDVYKRQGYYWFTKSLLMDSKSNMVITGAGMENTILSFKGQLEGAEGIKISNCKNIQIIGLTVEDSKGDNIKVTDTDGILFSKVKTYWTGGAKESNGAYGLYPVLCNRVVIEDCVAARASDAGVYVGQSDSVIIRRNVVFENVAGIESENSNFVEIYDNHTYDNTGGILVFDLPGLTQYGHHTRVFNNKAVSYTHLSCYLRYYLI